MRPSELFKQAGIVASAVAVELQITQSAISQWDQIPAERVLKIEQITGIPRGKLRPDLYPADREASA